MANEQKKNTLAQMVKDQKERYGEGSMFTGKHLIKSNRIPFGVFPVDFITGGGLPMYGSTCVWGKKSGGKTSLLISSAKSCINLCFRCYNQLLLCSCSRKAIRQKPVWVDVEGTLDKKWAESIGVTENDYYFALGDNGEMCMNMAHEALTKDDCGLVIIDSLGALIPEAEFDAPLDDQFYAIQARLISRSVRKLKQRLIKERKREHPCALICANQVRANMGAMKFETKEKQPGGFSMEHEFSLLLKSTKKFLSADKDKKYFCSTTKNALAARFSVYMEKYKIETFGGIAEYVRADKNISDMKLKKGEVDDYAYVLEKAKDAGIIVKHSKGWKYFNDIAKKQVDIRDMWKTRPEEYSKIQKEIIDRMRVSIG